MPFLFLHDARILVDDARILVDRVLHVKTYLCIAELHLWIDEKIILHIDRLIRQYLAVCAACPADPEPGRRTHYVRRRRSGPSTWASVSTC